MRAMEAHGEAIREERQLTWWISRSLNLPLQRRSGWVVSYILEEFQKEESVALLCRKEGFDKRMAVLPLGTCSTTKPHPERNAGP